jgi:hypothetical protein
MVSYNFEEEISQFTSMSGEYIVSLNQIFIAIAKEIETLKSSIDFHESKIEEQEKKLTEQKKKLNALEYKILMKEIKINGYELVRLFRNYYVDDIISKHHSTIKTWDMLTSDGIGSCFFQTEPDRTERLFKKFQPNRTDFA